MARTRELVRQGVPTTTIDGPVRTCVGCRSRGSVSELLRVVVVDGVLAPDPRRRLPGRGAWLHPEPDCLHRAERRSAFPRALRVPGPLESGALHGLLDPEVRPDGPMTGATTSRARTRKQVDPP